MTEKRLIRQLKRALGTEDPNGELAALRAWLEKSGAQESPTPEQLARWRELVGRLPGLLDVVDRAYAHASRMTVIADRAVKASTREFTESTRNLMLSNHLIKAMLNSLGQAFFVFDRSGLCQPLYSKACEELIETVPAGRPIADVLRLPHHERAHFDGWVGLLFDGAMDFDDLAEIGPRTFPHSKGRYVWLDYRPTYTSEGVLQSVVVIATDKTSEREAERLLQEKQEFAEMILKISTDRNQFYHFVREVRRTVGLLRGFAELGDKVEGARELRRLLHSLKGLAAAFYLRKLKEILHSFESEVAAMVGDPRPDRFAGFGGELERLLDEELFRHRKLLGPGFEKQGMVREVPYRALAGFARELSAAPQGAPLRRKFLEELVAVPLSEALAQFNGVLQQSAVCLNKSVAPIRFEGEDPRILAPVYEDFISSLIHLFRNAVAHGIEDPAERKAASKPAAGIIVVTGSREMRGGQEWLRIEISDDGRGLDPAKIRQKLKERGAPPEVLAESDAEIIRHVFDAGFSTSDQVSELSGRGVGLNVIQEAVTRLRGSLELRATPGKGSCFSFLLPHLWELPESLP
ncbi:MAG: ATP-binding protein [Oligoflexia bacterium]|nr:ATP-binding protein [Oligoflexia bacterium]